MGKRSTAAKTQTAPTKGNDIATRAQPFIERIETLQAEKKVYCEGCAEDIKHVVEEAEEAGIAPKALKRALRLRKLQRDIDGLPAKLDLDESAQFEALAAAFGDSPFGHHAAQLARQLRDSGATVEVRGGTAGAAELLRQNREANGEAPREDEEHLARIGRGPSDADVVDDLTH